MRRTLQNLFTIVSATILLAICTVAFSTGAGASVNSPCASWLRIIDISSNNKHPLNWNAISSSGIVGVYIKNTEGTWYTNPFWKNDAQQASKAGVPYGIYQFAQPGKSDPVASAKYFVAQGGASGQFPPALDLEVTKLTGAQTVQWAITWLNTVQQLTGRRPILYTGYYTSWSSDPTLGDWTLWLPAYPKGYQPVSNVCALPLPTVPAPWTYESWALWQYTSVGHPNGTGNNTDISAVESWWFTVWTGAGVLAPTQGVNKYPAALYSYGSHGTKVFQIQTLLVKQGFLPTGSEDGYFGLQTKHALEKYQQKVGVTADGQWSLVTQTASDFFAEHGYTSNQQLLWQSMGKVMKDNWKGKS